MLGNAKRKLQIGQLGVIRTAPGRDLEGHVFDHRVVAALYQQPAGDGLCGEASRARIGQAARKQQAQIASLADDRDGFFGRIGCDDYFGEDFSDGARGIRVELPVQRDDAAIGRDWIAGQRLAIGSNEVRAFGDAAGIGVLDDHASGGARGIEFGQAFVSCVGVVDVVV